MKLSEVYPVDIVRLKKTGSAVITVHNLLNKSEHAFLKYLERSMVFVKRPVFDFFP
jgi:hypothetical protein